MMALANLLEHPVIRPETMSGGIAGREMKRSSKDLGRVLAIAYLATSENPDALEEWPEAWSSGLRTRFPDRWRRLTAIAGTGLVELLANDAELADAHFTCINGLLASKPPSLEQLATAGRRLIQEAIEPLGKPREYLT